MKERLIYIPLAPTGGRYGDDFELRYALRSIAALWQGSAPVIAIFGRRPAWLRTDVAVATGGSHWDARKQAAVAAGLNSYLWWMDDCFLLKRSTWEQFEVPRAAGSLIRNIGDVAPTNVWRSSLVDVAARLAVEGKPCLDFSTPHAPYVCTGAQVLEACAVWEAVSHNRFPLESWMLNDGRPSQTASDVMMDGLRAGAQDLEDARLLVVTDRSLPRFRKKLENKFPRKSPWEK